jgi:hypothetical protein
MRWRRVGEWEGAGAAVVEWGGALMVEWWRRTGAGRPGTAPGCGGRRGEERGGARPEVGDGPDRWAPPVGGSVRERGREGEWAAGQSWAARQNWVARPKAGAGPRMEKKGGVEVARGVGLVCLFFSFFSFSFFFKSIFKPISNLFKFKSFTCFQIKILTQISPTILKAFHKLFLTTFQTYFKFKLSFFLIQTFTPIFTIIFKDFFTKFF